MPYWAPINTEGSGLVLLGARKRSLLGSLLLGTYMQYRLFFSYLRASLWGGERRDDARPSHCSHLPRCGPESLTLGRRRAAWLLKVLLVSMASPPLLPTPRDPHTPL